MCDYSLNLSLFLTSFFACDLIAVVVNCSNSILPDSKYNFKITPVYVTLDPQRDSPAQLKAYLEGQYNVGIILLLQLH